MHLGELKVLDSIYVGSSKKNTAEAQCIYYSGVYVYL